jgi:zinc-ribbon domain
MKKVWKWIIGIVLGLVVLAVLVGVGFMVRSNFHVFRAEAQVSRGFYEPGPGMMPYGGFGYHMRGPGIMGYGMTPFGGFFGGLLSLGFLALVVLGIIWLVRLLRTPKPVDVSAAMPASMPAAIVNPCKNCGRPIQDDWKVCPYCGKKV